MSAVVRQRPAAPPRLRPAWPRSVVGRGLEAAVAFGIAFAVDLATERRWSSVWGGVAIAVSVVAVVPRVRPLVAPIGAYAGAWVGFNLLRAGADDVRSSAGVLEVVPRLEAGLFDGRLPAAVSQTRWFDPNRPGWHDVLLTAVHLSFFVVPHVAAAVLLWRDRTRFRRYLAATVLAMAVGLVSFALLPTNPPWLTDAAEPVARIADVVLADLGVAVREGGAGPDQRYAFEPNAVASMPSIHAAATALVVLAVGRAGWVWRTVGAGYGGLMAVALVYLGEHHVLDVLAGVLVAGVAWRLARDRLTRPGR